MKTYHTGLTKAETAQTTANLKLVALFIAEQLDQPDDAEPIPTGASIVLLPPDVPGDPELAKANLRMAEKLAAEGRNVVVRKIGRARSPNR